MRRWPQWHAPFTTAHGFCTERVLIFCVRVQLQMERGTFVLVAETFLSTNKRFVQLRSISVCPPRDARTMGGNISIHKCVNVTSQPFFLLTWLQLRPIFNWTFILPLKKLYSFRLKAHKTCKSSHQIDPLKNCVPALALLSGLVSASSSLVSVFMCFGEQITTGQFWVSACG